MKAFEYYKKHKEKDNTDNMVKLLDNIQTNYVTVAKEDAKAFKDAYILTPLELYDECVWMRI